MDHPLRIYKERARAAQKNLVHYGTLATDYLVLVEELERVYDERIGLKATIQRLQEEKENLLHLLNTLP